MTQDEFISRTNAVVEQMRMASANFEAALPEERRRYWLAFVDAFDKYVEQKEEKHRRKNMNPYKALIGGGLMIIGEVIKRESKNFWPGYLSKLGDDISKGTDLVIRVSPKEGILMFEGFDILELPKGAWGKQDARGRLLITPTEFKSRIQVLRRDIWAMEEPWPLPVEVKQGASTLLDRLEGKPDPVAH
jgi:hypothetical protein